MDGYTARLNGSNVKNDLSSKTHLGHERGGIFMLAVRYAAVTTRGCSSAVTAAASAAGSGSGSAAAAAAAVAASASTGAGAGAARAKSASRGCSRLIAPTNGFLSHRLASLNLALLSLTPFSLPFFLLARSFFHTGCSRATKGCVTRTMDARFAKSRADRPTLRQWLRFR